MQPIYSGYLTKKLKIIRVKKMAHGHLPQTPFLLAPEQSEQLSGRPDQHVLGQHQPVDAQLPGRTLFLQIANLAVNTCTVVVVLPLLVSIKGRAFGISNANRRRELARVRIA